MVEHVAHDAADDREAALADGYRPCFRLEGKDDGGGGLVSAGSTSGEGYRRRLFRRRAPQGSDAAVPRSFCTDNGLLRHFRSHYLYKNS
jgi:hypothetical protein